jgi:hypothetical protein
MPSLLSSATVSVDSFAEEGYVASKKGGLFISTLSSIKESLESANLRVSKDKLHEEPCFHKLIKTRQDMLYNASAKFPYDIPVDEINALYKTILAQKSASKVTQMLEHEFHCKKENCRVAHALATCIWAADLIWSADAPSGQLGV